MNTAPAAATSIMPAMPMTATFAPVLEMALPLASAFSSEAIASARAFYAASMSAWVALSSARTLWALARASRTAWADFFV